MPISREDIEYTANLAKLSVSDESTEDLTLKMSNILGYFEKLQEVPTDDIPPTTHVDTEWGTPRGDVPTSPLSREKALENAPDTSEGHFVVPRVL